MHINHYRNRGFSETGVVDEVEELVAFNITTCMYMLVSGMATEDSWPTGKGSGNMR